MCKIKIYDYSYVMNEIQKEYINKTRNSLDISFPKLKDIIMTFSSGEKATFNNVDGFLCYVKVDSCCMIARNRHHKDIINRSEFFEIFYFHDAIFEEIIVQKGPYLTVVPENTFLKAKLKNEIYFI